MKYTFLLLVVLQMPVLLKGQLIRDADMNKLSKTDWMSCWNLENDVLDCMSACNYADEMADTLLSWKIQEKAYTLIKEFLLMNHLAQDKKIRDSVHDFLSYRHSFCLNRFIRLTHCSAFEPEYAENFLDYLLMYQNYNLRSAVKLRNDSLNPRSTFPLFYSAKEIRSRLENDEIAIQFFFNKYPLVMGCYIFLISPDQSYVSFLEMDEAVSIWLNIFVYNIYESMTTEEWVGNMATYKGIGAYLHDCFPEAFEKAKTVYLAGNGIMNLMPYNISHLKEGEYMMERWNFHQLTSLNEIPELKERSAVRPRSVVLFGDMQYYSEPVEYRTNMHTRGITTRGDKLQPLPYSAQEVDKIEQLLATRRIPVEKFTRQEALEDNLCRLGGASPQVLHISTHAFFLTEFHPPAGRKVIGYNEQEYLAEYGYGQGLFFSNSGPEWNRGTHRSGILPKRDNIITAYEISQLDLSNTDLVILSACDTGQGSGDESIEYMGLVRAFKIAGVKSVLMSLWEVDDKATGRLMTLFYEEWLNSADYREAFRKAQMRMQKMYSNPYYWAGFVLMD